MSCCPTYRPQELVIEPADYLESLVGTIGCSTFRLASSTEGSRPTVTSTGLIQFSTLSLADELTGLGTASSPLRFSSGTPLTEEGWKWDGTSWDLAPWPSDGEVLTFTNLGAGEPVLVGKTLLDVSFKTLLGTGGTTLGSDANEIVIATPTYVAGSNIILTPGEGYDIAISTPGSTADLRKQSIVYVDSEFGDDLTGTLSYANRPYEHFFADGPVPSFIGVSRFDFGEPVHVKLINGTYTPPIVGWNQLFPDEPSSRIFCIEGDGDVTLVVENLEIYTCPAAPVRFKNITFLGGNNIATLVVIPKVNVLYAQNEVNLTFENCTFDCTAPAIAISWGRNPDDSPMPAYGPTTLTFINCKFKCCAGNATTGIIQLNNTSGITQIHGPTVAGNSGNIETVITFIGCAVVGRLPSLNVAKPLWLVYGSSGAGMTCVNVTINVLSPMVAQWDSGGFLGTTGATINGATNLIVGDALPF